ncbi:MAG: hypothetical protein WC654_03715 [Patescibacteria group bacterium]
METDGTRWLDEREHQLAPCALGVRMTLESCLRHQYGLAKGRYGNIVAADGESITPKHVYTCQALECPLWKPEKIRAYSADLVKEVQSLRGVERRRPSWKDRDNENFAKEGCAMVQRSAAANNKRAKGKGC